MAKRKRGAQPTPAQRRATMNNFCLRSISGLEHSFKIAGHHDFEQRMHEVDEEFRTKLRETAEGYENTKEATK